MEGDQEKPLTKRPRGSLESVPFIDLQRLDSKLRQVVSMNARHTLLLGRSKKLLTALLVAKCRKRGDSEDSIENLVDDIHMEDKRQIVERILGMVSFRDQSARCIDFMLLDSRYMATGPSRGKQRKRRVARNSGSRQGGPS